MQKTAVCLHTRVIRNPHLVISPRAIADGKRVSIAVDYDALEFHLGAAWNRPVTGRGIRLIVRDLGARSRHGPESHEQRRATNNRENLLEIHTISLRGKISERVKRIQESGFVWWT